MTEPQRKTKTDIELDMAEFQLKREPSLPLLGLAEFRGATQCANLNRLNLSEISKRPVADKVVEYAKYDNHGDFLVIVGKQQFRYQRLILDCHSKYTQECIKDVEISLPVDKVTPQGFLLAYEWMLQEQPLVGRKYIAELLAAAIFLEVEELVRQVWYCLDQLDWFSELQAALLAEEARLVPDFWHVEELMLHRIKRFFLTLVATKEFVCFPVSSVCALFSSNMLAVNTEKEVFYAALRWFAHDWPARQPHLAAVMSKVRMAMLPVSFLEQLKLKTDDPAVDQVTMLPEFKHILSEARFASSLWQFGDDSLCIRQIYQTFDLRQPVPRKFICHDLSFYHKLDPNEPQDPISYRNFLGYLQRLQIRDSSSWRNLKPRDLHNYRPC